MASFEDWCESKGIKMVCQGGARVEPHNRSSRDFSKKEQGWEHFAWTCTLSFEGRTFTSPFKCGVAHVWKIGDEYQSRSDFHPSGFETRSVERGDSRVGEPKAPDAAAVLACLLSDGEGAAHDTFAEWCDGLGYSEDSRAALAIYLACQETFRGMRTLLGATYAEAVEAAQDY